MKKKNKIKKTHKSNVLFIFVSQALTCIFFDWPQGGDLKQWEEKLTFYVHWIWILGQQIKMTKSFFPQIYLFQTNWDILHLQHECPCPTEFTGVYLIYIQVQCWNVVKKLNCWGNLKTVVFMLSYFTSTSK